MDNVLKTILKIMDTLETLRRDVGGISISKVSKIPRWCKPEQSLKLKCQKTPRKVPTVFTKNELIGICEPPVLKEDALHAVWKVKAKRREVDEHLRETVAHVDFLKSRLKEVKAEIEVLSLQLEDPLAFEQYYAECPGAEDTSCFVKESAKIQQALLDNIDLEENLMQDLENAHRKLWEAGIADQFFSVEVEEKFSPVIYKYEKRRAFMAQKRAVRENLMTTNAAKIRVQTLKKVVASIDKASQAKPKKTQLAVRVLGAKNAKNKAEKFIKKTIAVRRQQKLLEESDQKLKQDRQHRLLYNLKKEMDDQKDTLAATSLAKRKRAERIEKEKEEVRRNVINSGKNPYYIEHLLAIEEKRALQQKKILDKETERLIQLQRDYEVTEKSKRQEEARAKKWDAFWAKKLEERKKAFLNQELVFLDEKKTTTEVSSKKVVEEPVHVTPKQSTTPIKTKSPTLVPPTGLESSTRLDEQYLAEADSNTPQNEPALEGNNTTTESTGKQSIAEPEKKSKTDSVSIARKSSGNAEHQKAAEDLEAALEDSNEMEVVQVEQAKKRSSKLEKLSITKKSIEKPQDVIRRSLPRSMTMEGGDDEEEGENDEYEDRPFQSLKKKSQGSAESLTDEQGEVIIGEATVDVAQISSGSGDASTPTRSQPPRPRPQYKFKPKNKTIYAKPAFRWSPSIITFSDYDIGKTYFKTLTVTNISTERVKFSLNEFVSLPFLEEDGSESKDDSTPSIVDLVKVNFHTTKTLSPGLTHDIHLVFKPPMLKDWRGLLKFHTSMEPFHVVVECLKKRFIPVISPTQVVFKNICYNTSAIMTVKLNNNGAKGGFLTNIVQIRPADNTDGNSGVDSYPEVFSHPTSQMSMAPPVSNQSSRHSNSNIELEAPAPEVAQVSVKKGSNYKSSKKSRADTTYRIVNKVTKSSKKSRHHFSAEHFKIAKHILNDVIDSVTSDIFLAYVKECRRELEQNVPKHIVIVFRPPYVDTFKSTFELYLESSDFEPSQITFQVEGFSIPNPVLVDPPNTDFRICMMDHNYQQIINVSTSVRGAGKVMPEVPHELRPYVSFSPKQATVFSSNPGRFCIKFHPNPNMLEAGNGALHYIDKSSMIIDFPVYFHLKFPYKVCSPLMATFMAVMTDQKLEFIPEELNMGKCTSVETVQQSFSIFNNSMLPQTIGFIGVPECIVIQPNFGFATLLPHEKRDFDLMLSLPETTTDGDCLFSLKCQTLEKREYFLAVKAKAKVNTIQLSQTKIFFPVTAVESASITCIEIYNSCSEVRAQLAAGNHHAKFEFAIKPDSPISISPKAGYLSGQSRVKLLVRFDAKLGEYDIKKHYLKMLQNSFIEYQANLQRELDGINQTLKYEMVFGEDDLEEEFVRTRTSLKTEEETTTIPPDTVQSPGGEKRTSFIEKAPILSNIRLTLRTESSSDSPSRKSRKSKRKTESEKRLSQASDTQGNKRGSGTPDSKDVEDDTNKKRSSQDKRNSKGRNSKKISGPEPDPILAARVKAYKALERRRDEVIKLLAVPHNPPNIEDIDTKDKQFLKAHRDLMKNMVTTSHLYTIPCFVTDPFGEVDVLFLYIKCAMTQPSLLLLEETTTFNFGTLAIGSRSYQEVHWYNVCQGDLRLKMDSLNPHGPFTQVNALRKLPHDHVFTLKLRFQPQEAKQYEETVRMFGGDSRIPIKLIGSAVKPEIKITPIKPEMFIGTINVGLFGYQDFEISNLSEAELEFSVISTKSGTFSGAIVENVKVDNNNEEETQEISAIPPTPNAPPPSAVKFEAGVTKPKRSLNKEGSQEISDGNDNVSDEYKQKRKSRKSIKKRSLPKEQIPQPLITHTHKKRSSQNETNQAWKKTMTFEVKEGDKTLNLNGSEMVDFLQRTKKDFLFQVIPSKLKVPPKSTGKFSVFFIPSSSGRFFSEFQLRLFQQMVHQFSVVGVGYNDSVTKGEAEE